MQEIENKLKSQLRRTASHSKSQHLFEILVQLARSIPFDSIQSYPRPDHPIKEKRGDAFRCFISIIISQRTTLEKEVQAGSQLFLKYRTPEEMVAASMEEIAELIKPAGMSKNKADVIKKVSREILKRYKGNLENLKEKTIDEARQELMELPGIGPKSADCFLELGLGMLSLAIDINVYRTTKRLGFVSDSADRDEVKCLLESLIPNDIEIYRAVHTYLLALGKYYCRANPLCNKCPVSRWCRYFSEHQNKK